MTLLEKQLMEAQLYIHTLARELARTVDERDAALARVMMLEATADGCIPVEVVDVPTIQRTQTRRDG
jgi:hypothetical protein